MSGNKPNTHKKTSHFGKYFYTKKWHDKCLAMISNLKCFFRTFVRPIALSKGTRFVRFYHKKTNNCYRSIFLTPLHGQIDYYWHTR